MCLLDQENDPICLTELGCYGCKQTSEDHPTTSYIYKYSLQNPNFETIHWLPILI